MPAASIPQRDNPSPRVAAGVLPLLLVGRIPLRLGNSPQKGWELGAGGAGDMAAGMSPESAENIPSLQEPEQIPPGQAAGQLLDLHWGKTPCPCQEL